MSSDSDVDEEVGERGCDYADGEKEERGCEEGNDDADDSGEHLLTYLHSNLLYFKYIIGI